MNAFFDTNVLVAAVTNDTDRSDTAVRILNECTQGFTSILNVMDLRSVLAKKKAFKQERINRIEDQLVGKTTVVFPNASDVVAANENQSETLLYPMDALILAAAESVGAPLVSFDAELVDHSAVEPETLLSTQ